MTRQQSLASAGGSETSGDPSQRQVSSTLWGCMSFEFTIWQTSAARNSSLFHKYKQAVILIRVRLLFPSLQGASSSQRAEAVPQQPPTAVPPQLLDRVDALTTACHAAQRERMALQQILESKVKRMMSDLAIDMASCAGEQQVPEVRVRI